MILARQFVQIYRGESRQSRLNRVTVDSIRVEDGTLPGRPPGRLLGGCRFRKQDTNERRADRADG